MRSLRTRLVALLVLVVLIPCPARAESPSEAAASPTEADAGRMDWWREAKFGMFIHWGVYAVPAGQYHGEPVPWIGEWIMRQAEIPVAEYRSYAQDFNPTEYDPAAWAALAKRAGMRYVVITSKHHDGFALYDSDVTDWDIADASPYGKDLLGPLAEAVREEGLKFGLYFSQSQDWTHPGGSKMHYDEGQGWDAAHKGDFDRFLQEVSLPQAREILTRYEPSVLWWDTQVWMTEQRAKPFNALLAERPGLITNNRLGGGFEGDTETPEQHIPATGFKGRDWETCMTMNDTWGYKSDDHNWKSTETLLTNLIDIVSKGGNYLLNVGPTADGRIPQESIDRLLAIGAWMDTNGESIYGTTASPCRRPAWGRLTRKGDRLFLHVLAWPEDGELVVPIEARVAGCRLLADPSRGFTTSATEDGVLVRLSGAAVDPICSVVELRIEGEPTEVIQRVRPGADGDLVLAAAQAVPEGGLQVESIGGVENLGYWVDPADQVIWNAVVAEPGAYQVTAELAGPAPSRWTLAVGGESLAVETRATGDYQSFAEQPLGVVRLGEAGDAEVRVRPTAEGWNAINLRKLKLTRVR